jgi:hypothetical protein
MDPSVRVIDAIFDPVFATHLAQQPRRHPRECNAKIRLRSHLLDVRRRPARLGGKHVELHQKNRLAYAAQARVDEAPLVAAIGEPLDQRLEVLKVAITAGEVRWLAPGAGVWGFSRFCMTMTAAF